MTFLNEPLSLERIASSKSFERYCSIIFIVLFRVNTPSVTKSKPFSIA